MNPVLEITRKQKPFVYFHTHVLDQAVMEQVLKTKKSVEIDISMTDDGTIYVGHPLTFYSSRNLPPPTNLALDDIVKQAVEKGVFVVLDCKHVNALPKVQELISQYGSEHFLLHAFVKELSFQPWPPKIQAIAEESWPTEELPLDAVLGVKKATGVPVAVSCHGITNDRLDQEGQDILRTITDLVGGKVESVNFFLPKDETMALKYSKELLDRDFLPLIGIDHIPKEELPSYYLGATDSLESASDPTG